MVSTDSLTPRALSKIFQSAGIFFFHCLFVLVPLFFLTLNEELFEFNKMIAVYGLTVLILSSWIGRMIIDKKVHWHATALDIPILIFVITQFLSTILSIHPRTSWLGYYTRFHGGFISTLAYVILYYAYVNTVTKKYQYQLLLSIILGGLLVSLYAIPEHFGHSPSCYFILGEFNVSCWIQDVQNRVFGTFGQPNWLAAYAIMILPIATLFILTEQREASVEEIGRENVRRYRFSFDKKLRVLLDFALPILAVMTLFMTLLFTKSRSGFIGWGAGFAVFIFLGIVNLIRKDQPLRQIAISLLSIFTTVVVFGSIYGVLALTFGTPISPSVRDLYTTHFTERLVETPIAPVNTPAVNRLEVGGTDSGEIRLIVWSGAIDVWRRYPLFGSGTETFAYSYYRDRPMAHNLVSEWDFLYNKAHNEFLNILATTGAVGLFGYLVFQGGVLLYLFAESRNAKTPNTQLLAIGIFASLVSLHVSNFLGFSTVMVTVLMYILPAMVVVAHRDPSEEHTHTHQFTSAQLAGIVGLAITTLYLLANVFGIWLADYHYARAKTTLQSGDLGQSQQHIQQSLALSPNEGLYYELQSKILSQGAIALAQEESTLQQASRVASEALDASDRSLILNPVHLNFYRSRVQVLLTLAQAQPEFMNEAIRTIEVAKALAPTDPKLLYNEGVIYMAMEEDAKAIEALIEAVEMKPNYEPARYQLGQLYEKQQQLDLAREQYQYILDNINPENALIKERMEILDGN